MKKSLISLAAFIFLSACSNQLDSSLVSKYENQLNTSLKQSFEELSQEIGTKVEFANFHCQADGSFIECKSQGFSVFDRADERGKKVLETDEQVLRTNEIYQNKDNTLELISLKEYYNDLFKTNKEIQGSIVFKNIRLTKEKAEEMKQTLRFISDEKMKNYVNKLINDSYSMSFEYSGVLEKQRYNYDVNTKFYNSNSNINAVIKLSMKEGFLDFLDSKGIKFNTHTLNIDEKAIKEFVEKMQNEPNVESDVINAFQENIIINDLSLETSLDTENVFESYMLMARGWLEMMKNESSNEKQAVLDKMLSLLNDISKNPIYKLDVNVKLKDIPIAEYERENVKVIEKLTINKQDFTEILKEFSKF